MRAQKDELNLQIHLIEEAMKKAGLWSMHAPDWISQYQEGRIVDIWQWLQFIHLPMRRSGRIKLPNYLAPQIRHYMKSEPDHRRILQLVIELDSITSTLDKN